MPYTIAEDKTIYRDNKIIFFSLDKFITEIIEGDNCFICGIDKAKSKFNDEHIIPDWILKKLELFSASINLPNGDTYRYDKYKIPCCTPHRASTR